MSQEQKQEPEGPSKEGEAYEPLPYFFGPTPEIQDVLPFEPWGGSTSGFQGIPFLSIQGQFQSNPFLLEDQLFFQNNQTEPLRNSMLPFTGTSSPSVRATNISSGSLNNDLGSQGANIDFPHEYMPRRLDGAAWPNFAPGYSPLPGQKQSRLPLGNVAQKTPRPSVASSPVPNNPQPQLLSSRLKSTQRQTIDKEHRSGRATPNPIRKPAAKSAKSRRAKSAAAEALRTTASASNGHLAKPTRGRRIARDEEDDDYVDDDEQHSYRQSVEINTASAPESNETSPTYTTSAEKPGALLQTPCPPPPAPARKGPRPRYEYPVPTAMEGLRKALGDDNWNDYLILMEKRLLGEITEADFVALSKSIFSVFDGQTGRRVEQQVVNEVVKPVLREHFVDLWDED